jgi:hypothetical protein
MNTRVAMWDAAWERLSQRFEALAEGARRCNPDVRWRSGRHANAAFPFWAYLSFSRDDPHTEDLVISVSGQKKGESVLLTSDLSDEAGLVIADGPTAEVPPQASPDMVARSILEYIASVSDFLDAETVLICDRVKLEAGAGT